MGWTGVMIQTRLPFELDQRAETGALTAHGGVPLVIEAFRVSGAAGVVDEQVSIKRRKRGLLPSQLVEGLFSLWAAGGERCDDLAALREASRSGPTTQVGPGSQGSAGAAARARPAGAADRA